MEAPVDIRARPTEAPVDIAELRSISSIDSGTSSAVGCYRPGGTPPEGFKRTTTRRCFAREAPT